MRDTITKNITLNKDDYDILSRFAKSNGLTLSKFLVYNALTTVHSKETKRVSEFMHRNFCYVDDTEQKEIDSLNINFDDLTGKELTLNDIL